MCTKLSIKNSNEGNHSEERRAVDFVKNFNECILDITENSICIQNNNTIIMESDLEFTEENFLSKTYTGWFGGDSYFRVVVPSEEVSRIIKLRKQEEWIAIASIKKDGYAVHFNLVHKKYSSHSTSSRTVSFK
jgi:hypothetical protein